MQSIYVLFLGAIGIIIAIGVGLQLSNDIDEFIIYLLFWMLYIISIITFINIILVANYYLNMRNKTGPVGLPGRQGKRGEKGDSGLCDPGCRDNVCETAVTDMIINELKTKNNGAVVKLNNVYIKSKIRLMCTSDEYKQLTFHNGALNLLNYVKGIWKIWFDVIYKSGGLKYFENVGAESDFEWLSDNPFDELKKFDIFYWGMGKQYRPIINEKCYNSTDGNTINSNYILKVSKTNSYEPLGNDTGSGAYHNVSFWRAKPFTDKNNVYYPVGDLAVGPSRANEGGFRTIKIGDLELAINGTGPDQSTIIVSGDIRGPVDYLLIWSTEERKSGNKFWVWRPIPPAEYIALGDIVTFTSGKPGTGDNAPIRCVPKEMTYRNTKPCSLVWSSLGTRLPSTISIVGFNPSPNGETYNASASNSYNLFRTIPEYNSFALEVMNAIDGVNARLLPGQTVTRSITGYNITIPDSDVNCWFYSLNTYKYDDTVVIGRKLTTNPDVSAEVNRVGKGYLPSVQKDAKYSIMAYLNLKNNATLIHNITQINVDAELVPNAISNAYLIKTNNKCINYNNDNILIQNECDELVDTQLFSIIFTGNKKNECKLQHYKTKKYLIYYLGSFTLIDVDDNSGNTLFTMS